MSCSCEYCKKVDKCKAKIRRLERAAEELDHCATPFVGISNKLNSLANSSTVAFESNNTDMLINTIQSLDSDMDDAMDDCQDAIGRSLQRLRRDLVRYEKEADDHHAEDDNTTSTTTTQTTS